MKLAITITARMKSERLPLKVMRYLKRKPMIEHMIDRLKLSKYANEIILCTSDISQDDILIDVAEKKEIKWFRGSAEDVLDRLYNASLKFNVDFIVSVTADNPLVDSFYVDKIFESYIKRNTDYVTCYNLPVGIYGFGVKISSLKRVIELKKEKETEKWGKFFEKNENFLKEDLEVEEEMNYPDIRLTVDEIEDLELMKIIFNKFYKGKNDFSIKEVISYLLKNPEIMKINNHHIHWTKK